MKYAQTLVTEGNGNKLSDSSIHVQILNFFLFQAIKNEKLASAKLPTDFFDDLDEAVPKKQVKPKESKKQKNKRQKKTGRSD